MTRYPILPLLRVTAVALATLLSSEAFAARKIVFLAGAPSHGPGEHEFHAGCQLLAKHLNESKLDIEATVIRGWPQDPSMLDGIKGLVIYADGTSVVGQGWDKVDQLAKSGVGLMFMHYAVHPTPEQGEKYYRPWIGGAFEDNYSVNPHWVANLKTLPNHPVSNGVASIVEAFDEFYYNMRFIPDRSKLLDLVVATPTRENMKRYNNMWNEHGVAGLGKPHTLMWGIERKDGGRGVGFTGGHYHRSWAIDGFRKMVLNAIVWSAGLEVPKTGVPTRPLTEEELNANLDDKGQAPRLTLIKKDEFKSIPTAAVQTDRESQFPKLPKQNIDAAREMAQNEGKEVAKALASTEVMTANNARLQELKANLKGAKELYLIVENAGNMAFDWANWIEPTLIMADGSKKDLTALAWRSAESEYGQTKVNANIEGGKLTIDQKTYEKGIGTHATSTIAYDLPAGVVGFTAKVGIDDGGAFQNGTKQDVSLKFAVYSQRPAQSGAIKAGLVPEDRFALADDDLEVTIWATTPQLYNPTNMDFDKDGRLFIAEGVNYRHAGNTRPEGDRIVVLEDTDADGIADETKLFWQDPYLESPLGVAVMDNQIVISQPPDLVVLTDVDRNLKFDPSIDKREVLMSGFNARQHDHSLHSVTAGPDGQWNFNNGNCGAIFTDKSGKTFRVGSGYYNSGGGTWYSDTKAIAGKPSDDGNVWVGGFSVRMNPDGTNARIVGHNYRNSYEQALTSFGDMFQSDNDDPPACRVTEVIEGGNAGFSSADGERSWLADRRPGQDVPTAEWRQEDPGTMPSGDVYGGGSPTGVAIYENGALGDKWQGLLLACEAGKNVIFGYLPKPNGAGFELKRMDFITSNKEGEFAGSDFLGAAINQDLKTRFRPADVAVGPDGALYVADWFDPRVGGHSTQDPGLYGTIYRIAPKGFKSVVPKIDLSTTEGQIAALKSPAVNVRYSGFTRLKAQGTKAIPALKPLLKDKNPYIAARAVWLLAQLGEPGQEIVAQLLSSKEPRQRLLALRALRAAGFDSVKLAQKMATDPAAMVRREVALMLRDVPAEQSVPPLAKIAAMFDGKDRAYLDALGLGSSNKEAAVYDAAKKLLKQGSGDAWSDAFAWIAWRLHPNQAVPDLKARAIAKGVSADQSKLMLTALGFNPTPAASAAMIELANKEGFAHKELAQWWVNNRKGNLWKTHGIDEILKSMGQDPANIKLVGVELPAAPANAQKLPPAAEIAQLKGDVERGKAAVATCYMCHMVGEQGVDYGPNLTSYGRQQPSDVIVKAIAEPSADISHGFEGHVIKTKDGITIMGMLLSDGDTVMIKCFGGQTQTVPRSRIESIKPLERSLMYDPAMLGLTPQSIADIAAYLKSL